VTVQCSSITSTKALRKRTQNDNGKQYPRTNQLYNSKPDHTPMT